MNTLDFFCLDLIVAGVFHRVRHTADAAGAFDHSDIGRKPDMAEGGGTDATKLNEALQASYGVVEQMLN